MNKQREEITIDRLINFDFELRERGGKSYYEKNTFFLTPGLNNWTYGWVEGDPVSGNLSQIKYMDEIEPVMNFKK